MFHFQLSSEFKAGAARFALPFAPIADAISQRFLSGARNVLIGGVAGWGAVVVAGAVLMANASHDGVAVPPEPAMAVAAPVSPAPAVAKSAPAEVATQPAKPAAPVVAAKTTQRVDMSPTAAIPAEPAHKPKIKPPHKKKAKDVDNSN